MGMLNWMRGLMGRKTSAVKPVETVSPVTVAKQEKKKRKVTMPVLANFLLLDRLPRLRFPARRKKIKVTVTSIERVCPGGRHAWFNSNLGLVRKQID